MTRLDLNPIVAVKCYSSHVVGRVQESLHRQNNLDRAPNANLAYSIWF